MYVNKWNEEEYWCLSIKHFVVDALMLGVFSSRFELKNAMLDMK